MKKFLRVWPLLRGCAAALGVACCYLAASTSDYHVIELGQDEPASVVWLLIIGATLMLPLLIHVIRNRKFYF